MTKACRLTTITETSPFNKEQLEHLYRLLSQIPSPDSLPSPSLAKTGKSISTFKCHSRNFTPWIIDFGASII